MAATFARRDAVGEDLARAGPAPDDWESLAREFYRMSVESAWGRVRAVYRGGWKPEIRLEGLERLEEALARGRGVILWRLRFCSSLVTKMALARAGVPVVHLSRWSHGTWGDTHVARSVLFPLFRRTEDLHLAGRIVIPRGESLAYMKRLVDHLEGGGVLSIFGDYPARQTVATRVFGTEASFARGAPSLAWKVGSALLPTVSVREGSGRYRVLIDPPIDVARTGAGKSGRDAFVEEAVQQFGQRLDTMLVRYPGSWEQWEAPAV